MANLIEGIQAECNRCRELVKQYDAIGQPGAFGKAMIEQYIRNAEAAIASGDVNLWRVGKAGLLQGWTWFRRCGSVSDAGSREQGIGRESMANLMEGILAECNRCRELVKQYDAIGQPGAFGKVVIEQEIRNAEAAIASGDVVDMVHALQALRDCR